MKTKITALILGLTFGLQAQFEPFDQFFFKTLWDNIPEYDSIGLWYGKAEPGNLAGTYYVGQSPTGDIDTMYFWDGNSGFQAYSYAGKRVGNVHAVVRYNHFNGSPYPEERISFLYDAGNQLQSVMRANFDGNIFVETAKFTLHYLPNGKMESLVLSAPVGSGYFYIGQYTYYYTANLLDSVITSYSSGSAVEKYQPLYNAGGLMTGMDFYENLGFSGQLDFSSQYLFQYNGSRIGLVERYVYFHNDSSLQLTESFTYGKKPGTGLGLPSPQVQQVAVYPNPVIDYLTVESALPMRYQLFDLNGKKLREGEIHNQLDVSSLKKGSYLLHLHDANGLVEVHKIMKR